MQRKPPQQCTWILLLVLILSLAGGIWWVMGSGYWIGVEDGARVEDESASRQVVRLAGETAAKQVEDPQGQDGLRERVGARGGEEDTPAYGIEGRVVDVLGKGLSGVEVSVCSLNVLLADGPKFAKLATVSSVEDGVFRFEDVQRTRVCILAETDGGDFGTVFVRKSPAAGWIRDMTVVVYAGRVVRGLVLDEQGVAIEGAWILPTPMLDTRWRYWQLMEQSSDTEGGFEIGGLPSGGYRLTVWAPGYRLALLAIDKDEAGGIVEVRLQRDDAIALRCRIDAEREVLAGILALDARVQIRILWRDEVRWELPSPFRGKRFAADGTCEFRGLRFGKISALFEANGEKVQPLRVNRDLIEGKDPEEAVWKPSFRQPLEARLVDEAARPLAKIRISYYRSSKSVSVISDQDGRIRIEEFEPEGVRSLFKLKTAGWYFEGRHGPTTMKTVSPGLAQVFKLVRGPSLAGRVLKADGEPVAGAEVVLFPDDVSTRKVLGVTESDAEGRFRMTPHWPKQAMPVRLAATLGSTFAIHPESLTLHKSSRIEGITLLLQGGATLEGRLVDADGRPAVDQALTLEEVKVDWVRLWNWQGGRTLCDSKGNFAFKGMPTGTWKLAIKNTDVFLDKAPILLELKIGTRRDLGTMIVRKGLAIAGKFLDLEGKPHPGKVQAYAARLLGMTESGQPRYFAQYGKVDSDGSFRVEGLSAGTYGLDFQFMQTRQWSLPSVPKNAFPGTRNIAQYRTQAEAGQTDLEFRVPKPGFGELEVRMLPDSSGWLPSDVHLSLRDPAYHWFGGGQRMPLKKGMILVQGVKAGSYQMHILHPRFGRLRQGVQIRKGQTSQAVVNLRELTGRIEVRVRNELGKVVVGAWVGLLPLVDNQMEIDDPWGIYWRPSRRLQGEVKSDASGLAQLLAAPVRESLVMVWKPGFVPFARRVHAGGSLIEVTLRKGPELRVQISKKTLGATDPKQPWGMYLRLLESAVKDRDPRLDQGVRSKKGVEFTLYGRRPQRLDTLPPGRYLLEGYRPGGTMNKTGGMVFEIHREFRLEAGKPLELDL